MGRWRVRRRAIAVAVGMGIGCAGAAAMGATVERTWTAGSGSFTTAGNWSPRGVPDNDDIATFNTAGLTATVAMPSANVDNLRLRVLQGTITLNTNERVYRLNAPDALLPGGLVDLESSSIQVGWTTLGTSTLIIDGAGTLRGVTLTAGRSAGSTGQIIVRNENTWLRLDSTLRLSAGGESVLTVEQTADLTAPRLLMSEAGQSSLNIATGGTAQFSEWVEVGQAGQAAVDVSGGGQMIWNRGVIGATAGGAGSVTVRGAGSGWSVSEDMSVGLSGTGMMNIRDDASAIVSRDTFIAHDPGSTGHVTVENGGHWTVQRDLYVGGSSQAGGGNGTVTVGTGGLLAVDGGIETWDGGRIELHGGTLRAGLLWRRGSGGTFDWTSGTLEITAGELWISPAGYFGTELSITTGRVLRVDGDIDLYAPMGTAAELSVAGGGRVEARRAFLGFFDGESGVATVAGAESQLILEDALFVGGGELAAGGTGAVHINTAGKLDAGALLQVWGGGAVDVNGGRVIADEIRVRGTMTMLDGSVEGAGGVFISGSGVFEYAGGSILTPHLHLHDGGRVIISPGCGKVLTLGAFQVDSAAGSGIDVSDNRLILEQGDLAQVHDLVKAGYSGGGWNGPGIFSSIAAVEPGRALGMGVDGDDVVVQFTWGGDATLDGTVTIADLGILAANWQQSSRQWWQGDFNYDGTVNIADLGILAANWQRGVGNGSGPTGSGLGFEQALAMFDVFDGVVVPEPGVTGWAALGALGVLFRWRRGGAGA